MIRRTFPEHTTFGDRDLRFAVAHSSHRYKDLHETRAGRTGTTRTQQGQPLQHSFSGDSFTSQTGASASGKLYNGGKHC